MAVRSCLVKDGESGAGLSGGRALFSLSPRLASPPSATFFSVRGIDDRSSTTTTTTTTQGKDKPVIMKALVELDGPRSQPFQAFAEQRAKWELHDMYRAPGKLSLSLLLLLCLWLLLWSRCC